MLNFKLLFVTVLLISCFVIQGYGQDVSSEVNNRDNPSSVLRSRRSAASEAPLGGFLEQLLELLQLKQVLPELLKTLGLQSLVGSVLGG
uniref:Uncharacterized protein n=1 Tax=Tetranychus urticae TaxID=32264 RepID=T1L5I7_TETUR